MKQKCFLIVYFCGIIQGKEYRGQSLKYTDLIDSSLFNPNQQGYYY